MREDGLEAVQLDENVAMWTIICRTTVICSVMIGADICAQKCLLQLTTVNQHYPAILDTWCLYAVRQTSHTVYCKVKWLKPEPKRNSPALLLVLYAIYCILGLSLKAQRY